MKTRFSAYLIIYCKLIFALNKEESEKEYAAGNAFLVNRQYSDALSHYHKSIEYDPTNYQAIFRRATTYLAFGRAKPALADLDTVLSQKPDFVGARQQRANVLIKIGQLAKAENDLRSLRKTSVIQEAEEKLLIVEESMKVLEDLKHSAENGYCEDVIEITTRLLELHPWDASLYTYRAKCYESNNNLNAAILDMKHATMISSDNTELLYELSVLEYKSADARNALGSTRECLKLNPDHKLCYKFYKWLKKIVKSLDSIKDSMERQNWSECLENGQKLLNENDGDMSIKINVYRLTSQCNREEGNIGAAVNECNEVLEFDSSDVETLIQRAEAYMADEEYDLAFSDYEKASELDSSNEAASTGKDQAKRAKELIGKRDYYKILGVRRNANKREITKAYRKMAQKWHPDNFQDEKEKKKAEKKFIDIAAAKEVLSDENKRRAFDNGKDPLDSEEKMHAHKGFHEFHGFNPFGGGRGDFFFHF